MIALLLSLLCYPTRYRVERLNIPAGQVFINDLGEMAGTGERAFFYQGGKLTYLPTGFHVEAFNNNGEAAGYSDRTPDARDRMAAFWSNETGLRFVKTPGYTSSEASGLNDNGDIVGSFDSGASSKGFLFAKQTLHTLKPNCNGAKSINNLGEIVVWSALPSGDFSYDILKGSKRTRIGYLTRTSGYYGDACRWIINNKGQGAGEVANIESREGFYWAQGTFTHIGYYALIYALNDSGIGVGEQSHYHEDSGGKQFAAIYYNGQQKNLNDLVQIRGYKLTIATGINNSGQIVARGTDSSGKTAEFY